MEDHAEFDTLLRFFKALGNESRLRLVGQLANGEMSVGALAEAIGVTEPTVSHHLRKLKEIGLARSRADGNVRYYSLNMRALENMSRQVFAATGAQLAAQKARTPEERVIDSYVRDGRLTGLPKNRAKRLVLIAWVAEQLDGNRDYHELELNDYLKAFTHDHAALRRYLVDEGFFTRARNIYRKLATPEIPQNPVIS